jgi:hypothetical protein
MQVAANGQVLVTGEQSCPTIDVNLQTGVQRLRRHGGTVRNLEASGDHRRIMQWDEFNGAIYRSDNDSLGLVLTLFSTSASAHAGPSLDHTGRRILTRNRLYDSTLMAYQLLQPDPGNAPQARALSADGTKAFIASFPGYWQVDVASGAVDERRTAPRA